MTMQSDTLAPAVDGSARRSRRGRRSRPDANAVPGSEPAALPHPDTSVATPKPKRQLISIGRTIKPIAVAAFSRQLSSFLQAGIPVLESLDIVAEETASTPMKAVISDISTSIRRGTSFVEAVDAHPEVFPAYYRAMLGAAEYTGDLDQVLAQLSAYLERDIASRRQVKSALTYPIIVFVVAVVAMFVMSIFVLPKFTGLYESLGADLPVPTRMLMGFTNFMTSSWPMLIAGIAIVVVGLGLVFRGTRGKGRRDVVAMKTPVIGNLFQLISLERFCRVLSSLATAGVPLPVAIGLSADSTNNTLFQNRMVTVREVLVRGGGLYEPMAETGLFPIAARQMIQVGERTGLLGSQLGRAAAYYEREVTFAMKKATQLFEPIVILFVALIVGFIAIAQIAAMYSIFGQVE
ncbi:MAG: type II secretion system F family protein [Ilumatobacteraceae bacterium]